MRPVLEHRHLLEVHPLPSPPQPPIDPGLSVNIGQGYQSERTTQPPTMYAAKMFNFITPNVTPRWSVIFSLLCLITSRHFGGRHQRETPRRAVPHTALRREGAGAGGGGGALNSSAGVPIYLHTHPELCVLHLGFASVHAAFAIANCELALARLAFDVLRCDAQYPRCRTAR